MMNTKVSIGFLICASIFAVCVYSQSTSNAKTITDLTNEVLKVINDNKSLTMRELVNKLRDQTQAAASSIKNSGGYPSQSEISSAISDLLTKLPQDGPITGDGIQRFQNGITSHLNRVFPAKST
ncbi:hypothetical protein ACKWTF_011477 [Chironomus riparius]